MGYGQAVAPTPKSTAPRLRGAIRDVVYCDRHPYPYDTRIPDPRVLCSASRSVVDTDKQLCNPAVFQRAVAVCKRDECCLSWPGISGEPCPRPPGIESLVATSRSTLVAMQATGDALEGMSLEQLLSGARVNEKQEVLWYVSHLPCTCLFGSARSATPQHPEVASLFRIEFPAVPLAFLNVGVYPDKPTC